MPRGGPSGGDGGHGGSIWVVASPHTNTLINYRFHPEFAAQRGTHGQGSNRTGKSGAWMSDRLPHLEKQIDDLCIIKSMRTDQFNHAPAQLLVQTGDPRTGHASLGAWVTYGLGSENANLPGFVVMVSTGNYGQRQPIAGN